jgi:pyruvate carboxylase
VSLVRKISGRWQRADGSLGLLGDRKIGEDLGIHQVAVAAGQVVKAGDVLLSIEAMKMETVLHAEQDGTVGEVLVKSGDQIDTKDLLVEIVC